MSFKKNEIVVKVIEGAGFRTASLARVQAVKRGVAFTGEGTKPDDVDAYDAETGQAKVNYISGFTSYLVALDGGEESKIKGEEV